MPVKIHYSGATTFYNVSQYQASAKDYLNDPNKSPRRFYSIKSKHRKQILSASKYLAKTKKPAETLIFFTLTYPSPINTTTGEINLQGQYNPYYNDHISKYLDYWKHKGIHKTKALEYIWTKELTNNLQIHYHVILKIDCKVPKGLAIEANKIWGNYTGFKAANGFRTGRKGLILKNIDVAVKYASKYVSKSQKGIEKFPSPAHRITNNIKVEAKKFHEIENDKEIKEIDENFNRIYFGEWADIGFINESLIEKFYKKKYFIVKPKKSNRKKQ